MKLIAGKRYRMETCQITGPLEKLEDGRFYDSVHDNHFDSEGICTNSINKDIIAFAENENVENQAIEESPTLHAPKENQARNEIDKFKLKQNLKNHSEQVKVFDYPEAGAKYKHYKGGTYRVVLVTKHTETSEILVITQSLVFGTTGARP